jgi:GAF domain-containing protein
MYELLTKQLPHILEGEKNVITNFSNFSALLFNSMENVNWVGFYIFTGKDLLLGPFQGKPACVRIEVGKGVCGTSFDREEIVLVKDVNQFPGHIACDANSQSEIVLPIVKDGVRYGVLDIDSPITDRFDDNDSKHLKDLLNLLISHTEIEELTRIYS